MLSTYRGVLATPGALLFSGAGLIARLPISMVSLGIVLLVSGQSGSYGLAGSVAAVFVLANALFAIAHGRLVDQYGQPRVLPIVISFFGVGLALLTVGVLEDWPTWSIYLTAAVTGAALPQVGACVRARWSYVLKNPTTVQTAYAVEGVADEVVFMTGPVLVTVLATTVHPAAGLVTALVAGVGGTLVFAALRSTAPPAHGRRATVRKQRAMPWRIVSTVAVIYFALGALFGAAEVVTVAFAEELDATKYAGVLLGVWALGSLLSGVAVGAITWRSGPVNRVRWGTIGLVVTWVPISFVDNLPVMAVLLFITGFAVSPTMIGSMSLIEAVVPTERLSEGLAVVQTGVSAGLAPGAAIAGIIIDAYGASSAYYVPLAAAAVAVIAAWLTNLPKQ